MELDAAEDVLCRLVHGFLNARQSLDAEELQRDLRRQMDEVESRAERAQVFCAAMAKECARKDLAEKREKDAELTEKEAKMRKTVEDMVEENRELDKELQELEKSEDEIALLEEMYWKQLNGAVDKKAGLIEKVASFQCRTELAANCRAALKQTNVLNDAFCIWYDGPFGTISGLRLGRLPDIPVEWSEINAAWGQVALLLSTLAREVHFAFSKYRIIPQGSVSKLAKVGSEKTSFELYHTGGFFKGPFNNAMVCILHCIQELGEYAEKTDRTMCLPFPIDGDKVGDLTIRMTGSEVNWTKALKNFLVDLKWLVAWSTKRHQRM